MASRGSFLSKAYSAARKAGLPDPAARVAASQAALESNFGKSAPGNNFFGIKAGKSWKGATQSLKTWEVVNGKKVSIKDNFRKYDDFKQSFQDWAKVVGRNWPDVLTAQTFDDAVAALNAGKQGGYATDPLYASKLGFMNERIGDALAYSLPDTMDVPHSLDQANAIQTAYADNMRALDVVPPSFSPPSRPATPTPMTALNTISPPSRFPSVAVGNVTRAPLDAIPASLSPAPVGRVERAPLPDIGRFSAPARSLQHPVSAPKPGPLAAAPVSPVTKGPALAPAVDMQALASQYSQYQPSKVTSMPTVAGMPSIPAPTGLPAAKPVEAPPTATPIQATLPAQPNVVAPLVQRPPVQDMPVASLPAAPSPPAATAYDVYSGLATEAKDNTGKNTVGMLPDGTSTVTNQWGVTTGMTPYGKQTAVGNLPSIPGISGPVARTAAKMAMPAIGSMVGGPLGGILGALASYGLSRPGGLLSNLSKIDTSKVAASGLIPGIGNVTAFAKPNYGLNSFPSRPSYGTTSRGFRSDGVRSAAYGMSPGAAAAIDRGQGGLY